MSRGTEAPISELHEFRKSSKMMSIKQAMLAGERSASCNACYAREEIGSAWSNRQTYNKYLLKHLDHTRLEDPGYENILYFDLSLSNKCNQKCRICGPQNSTSWAKDAVSMSDMAWSHPVKSNRQQVHFTSLEIIPEIIQSMSKATGPFFLEIKGGEPLYLDETRDLIKQMIAHGLNEKCHTLKFISNGTAYDDDLLPLIREFKNIDLSLSIDAIGKLHEYTRGSTMNWDQCRRRWNHLLENLKGVNLSILNTIYVYNVFDQANLRNWARSEYGSDVKFLDAYLTGPEYLNIKILTDELKILASSKTPSDMKLKQTLEDRFDLSDIMRPLSQRGLPYTQQDIDSRLSDLRAQFSMFTLRLDQLRNENLLDVVPELAPLLR